MTRAELIALLLTAAPKSDAASNWARDMAAAAFAKPRRTSTERRERLREYAAACDRFLKTMRPLDGYAYRAEPDPQIAASADEDGDSKVRVVPRFAIPVDDDAARAIGGQAFEWGTTEERDAIGYVHDVLKRVRALRHSIGEALEAPDTAVRIGGRGAAERKKMLAFHFASSWRAHFRKLPPTGEESKSVDALRAVFAAAALDETGARDQLRDAIGALRSIPLKG